VKYILPWEEPTLIETGYKLGDVTSEMRPSEFISQFASGGPKNYAYRFMTGGTGKNVSKVRGVTQNNNASKLVKFERIKDMIFRSGDEPQTVVHIHIDKKINRKKKRED